MPKKDGKVRICIDCRDLNKASSTNDLSSPDIDVLSDNSAGFAMVTFMGGLSGYNQICMALEDKEKTSFFTPRETFC